MSELLKRGLVALSNREAFGVSAIQRVCRIGYNRAAHMVDGAIEGGLLVRCSVEPHKLKLTEKARLKLRTYMLPPESVGDIVAPVSPSYALRSGASSYEYAYVVSMSPFVLASESGDMRWQRTVKPEFFHVIGSATSFEMENAMRRVKE